MKPILTADEYRRVDKAYTGDLGEAMDRAGHAVALAASRLGAGYGRSVVVLAGPGNNGGDGYVAARYLKERGAHVVVHALGEPKTPEATEAARTCGVPIRPLTDPVACDLVVDALFGGGVRAGLADELKAWMAVDVPVVSVDFPTGLDPDTGAVDDASFTASETVTFSTLKTAHVRGEGPERCGRVTVVDIGINGGEPSFYLAEESDAARPGRRRRAHKWSAGSVLVVGGSPHLTGAAVLAGRSALEFGAGTVYVCSPAPGSIHNVAPELPTMTFEAGLERLHKFDVVLAGPGLADEDSGLADRILTEAKRVVLDAGALKPNMLELARKHGGEVLVTPHNTEFERVSGVGAGSYSIRAFASRHGITVLLKGNPTLITDGCPPVMVASGGSELATIGTGDVLGGMIAALWARGLEGIDAAVSGAYWHGRAGRSLSARRSLTAPGLVEEIGAFAW